MHGMKIDYRRSRRGYRRQAFTATWDQRAYAVGPTAVKQAMQTFSQVVELPTKALHVRFHPSELPAGYRWRPPKRPVGLWSGQVVNTPTRTQSSPETVSGDET